MIEWYQNLKLFVGPEINLNIKVAFARLSQWRLATPLLIKAVAK